MIVVGLENPPNPKGKEKHQEIPTKGRKTRKPDEAPSSSVHSPVVDKFGAHTPPKDNWETKPSASKLQWCVHPVQGPPPRKIGMGRV